MQRAPEPGNASERELLLGWLAFHRDALAAKCDGLSAEQLVMMPAPPSDLSLLGLVRHMTEMEHAYLVHALAGGGGFSWVYCTAEVPDGDIEDLSPDLAPASLARWLDERARADQLLSSTGPLGAIAAGNRFSVRWNLMKVILEYARQNGHADIVRQRIDGATGE
ncbi:MAG TPA: DinB family protein [Streptosporangiaceae bacterium]|nr:DinB family protein [Streptosporangiaceae bacterium]